MALGGKSILIMEEFPDMLEIDESIPLREEIEKETIDWIKNIMIVQYSQITGKCPNGHQFCMDAKCWFEQPKEETK